MQSDAIKAKYLDGLVETTLVRDSGQLAAGHVNFPKKSYQLSSGSLRC